MSRSCRRRSTARIISACSRICAGTATTTSPTASAPSTDTAENAGYWDRSTTFLREEEQTQGEITFYDSVTSKPLFYAPRSRSWESFVKESKIHGWPSFRDDEVDWRYVRVLPNGECVSVDGTHLGHNLPDRSGNRYCINLVSVAGREVK